MGGLNSIHIVLDFWNVLTLQSPLVSFIIRHPYSHVCSILGASTATSDSVSGDILWRRQSQHRQLQTVCAAVRLYTSQMHYAVYVQPEKVRSVHKGSRSMCQEMCEKI